MKPQSAKAKGRNLQKLVRDALRELGKQYGLVDGDIESRGMGQNGVDVILSPAAQRIFHYSIECKAQQNLNVLGTFIEHYQKYPDSSLKLLVHSKNFLKSKIGDDAVVTMRLTDFTAMIKELLSYRNVVTP